MVSVFGLYFQIWGLLVVPRWQPMSHLGVVLSGFAKTQGLESNPENDETESHIRLACFLTRPF
jgi:hypothetical protein